MQLSRSPFARAAVLLLLTGIAFHPVNADTRKAAPTPSMESLLKAAGLRFTSQNGEFSLILTDKGEDLLVRAREERPGGPESPLMGHVFCPVIQVPRDYQHSRELLRRISLLNDTLVVGRLSIDARDGNIWLSSSFWLCGADAGTVEDELWILYYQAQEFRRVLTPMVNR